MNHKLLVNHQISPAIVDLIMEAREKVVLVSPYLNPWTHLMQQLDTACQRGVVVELYFRHDKKDDYKELTRELSRYGIDLFAVQFLHSKIYANEKACLLTSMNLLDFSASNSEEFALRLDDPGIVAEVHKYVEDLRTRAQPARDSMFGSIVKAGAKAVAGKIAEVLKTDGSCIRCGTKIEFNLDKPFCGKCFSSWNKYHDPTYTEKICHDCGKPASTSKARPQCRSCYSK